MPIHPRFDEYEDIIKDCDKIRIINFLKTIFTGDVKGNKKFGGTESTSAEGITILGSVTLPTTDGHTKPILCCAKQMGGILTERSSRRKQFDIAVKVLKDNFVNPYMGNGPIQGSFTQGLFFFFDEPGNFRLSLVTAEISAGKMELNNYRRQSFFVEAGKRNNTFRTRLCKTFSTFDELKSAFDVEKLSDDFFREYKAFYEDIVQYITGKRIVKKDSKKYTNEPMCEPCHEIFDQFIKVYGEGDNAERAVRNYVKKMMGRLVFIQFLQKKGWLGISTSQKDWHGGDTDFLQNLFTKVSPDDRENFVDNILEEIFFEAFNTKEQERKIKNDTLKQYKFPFLNCGLFDRDIDDRFQCTLPPAVFSNAQNNNAERKAPDFKNWTKKKKPYFNSDACGLFDFFDRFNFTIDENDPTDAEVSVDPEMLSKIFENLLEDNKDKGAFYTPKEIVNYMVNESLIAYLETETSKVFKPATMNKIRDFVLTQDTASFNDSEKATLEEKLAEVKICDPAIGSGAFPMGLLNLLCKCRLALKPTEEHDNRNTIAAFKRDIIQKNIYGVDIEKGAVDIARLRFWLSLVVDEETPEVLPNLEFKIMQGNSLLESYEGIDLSGIAGEKYKRTTAKSKDQTTLVFNEEQAMKQIQKDLNRFYTTESHIEKESLTHSINNNVKKYIKYIAPEKSTKIDAMPVPNDKFFLWHTYFRDVFDRKGKSGFDIVIGNPPYISAERQQENAVLKEQRERIKKSKLYRSLFQKWDLYIPFIELGTILNRNNGITTMIVPFPLTNQLYGKVLRKILVEENDLFELVDLNGTKIFENATVSNCIPFIRTSKTQGKTWISNINENLEINKVFSQSHQDLVQDEKNYVWNLTQENREPQRHADMHVLGDYCYISKGMVLHSEEGEFTKKDLISVTKDTIHCKKYVEAKDIEKYNIRRTRFLEYGTDRCPRKLSRPTFPELYNRQKIVMNCLGGLNSTIGTELAHNHSLYCAVLWQDIHGIQNKSIASSIKKYSTMSRDEMENLSKTVDLRFLLGIMNSKYASILLTNIRGGDYHIYPEHIRNIPIPAVPPKQQQPIIDLVNSILAEKKKDSAANTSTLEDEIDNRVYDLYGLSEPEINIIKGLNSSPTAQNDENNQPHRQAQGTDSANDNSSFLQGEDL
jgi:hypothetical protein